MKRICLSFLSMLVLSFCLGAGHAQAGVRQADVIMIGDRLVDVAFNLGVVPVAMSVRGGEWALGRTIARTSSKLLGCPHCVVARKPKVIAQTLEKTGIKHIIVEKSAKFCLYRPTMSPEGVVRHLEKTGVLKQYGVTVTYVDFTQGLESAVRDIGVALGEEDAASKLLERYGKERAVAEKRLSEKPVADTAVVLNGVYMEQTGKTFVRVEVPGGYSDRFLLEPLGIRNVAKVFVTDPSKIDKGHVTVRSLKALIDAAPEAIVMTGDVDAVQRALARTLRRHPALHNVPAIRNAAIFSLPRYIDSSVVEYPRVLLRWASAFAG